MAADVYQLDNPSIVNILRQAFNFTPASEMQSIVLVGGKGTRLNDNRKLIRSEDYPEMDEKYCGEIGPKGMAIMECETPIGKIQCPLTDWHLDIHTQCDEINKIILGLGYGADIMMEYYRKVHGSKYRDIPIEYLVEENPAGTLAPIIKLMQKNELPQIPIIFANGDNLMDIDFYRGYLIGCYFALKQGIHPSEVVIDIIALVPWEESDAYGTIDYDFETGIARRFKEKGPVKNNPHTTINGLEVTPINSGFSIIPNPKQVSEKYISNKVIEISRQLEMGQLDYKANESAVKYETLYEKIAMAGRLFGVYFATYWTDLGTEEKIAAAEKDFATTHAVKNYYS